MGLGRCDRQSCGVTKEKTLHMSCCKQDPPVVWEVQRHTTDGGFEEACVEAVKPGAALESDVADVDGSCWLGATAPA